MFKSKISGIYDYFSLSITVGFLISCVLFSFHFFARYSDRTIGGCPLVCRKKYTNSTPFVCQTTNLSTQLSILVKSLSSLLATNLIAMNGAVM